MDALTKRILNSKNTTNRFKLPLTTEQAYDILLACYKAEVMSREMDFEADEFTHDNLKRIAQHLTAQEGHKLGFILSGYCGSGKTTAIRAMRTAVNYLNDHDFFEDDTVGIVIYPAQDIANIAKQDYKKFSEICRTPILAIDDLGSEPTEINDFGSQRSPIAELIEYRYNNQLATYITTNVKPAKLKERYKERISDRFREMLDQIKFSNENSYRK